MGNAEDQVKFLISCIKYSSNGKIDWESVAKDCDIISKGAASKRYTRICAANGIGNGDTAPSAPNTPKKSPAKRGPTKGESPNKKAKGDPKVVEGREASDDSVDVKA